MYFLFVEIFCCCVAECDVLIICRQHNDKEWKFKEQHAEMWENIAGAKRYSRPRGLNIAGASAPVDPAVPTHPVSVRPSVPSIDSSSRVQLVCRSPGAGGIYRSISVARARAEQRAASML